MVKVAISEFRAHMSKYLMNVMEGEVIVLTSDGKDVAELTKPTDRKQAAEKRLRAIAESAKVGDMTTPVIDGFGAAE